MCFELTKTGKKLIATEDIICYKCLKYPCITAKGTLPTRGYSDIWGPYCYVIGRRPKTLKLVPKESRHTKMSSIYEGYHSYTKPFKNRLINAVFMIPKGAEYYKNGRTGHYVSSDIIFIKWMDGLVIRDNLKHKTFIVKDNKLVLQ